MSLVFSIITGLIGFVLGIIALVQIGGSRGAQKGLGFAFTGIALSIMLSPVAPIAIILFLSTVVKQPSPSTSSMNNLRQIAIAELNFNDANQSLPVDRNGLSWRVHILPFLDEADLYSRFNLDEPWNSPTNIQLLDKMPFAFGSDGQFAVPPGKTLYLRPVGNGAFPLDSNVTLEMITDGLSNTILALEVNPDAAVNWTEPIDYRFDPNNPRNDLTKTRNGRFLAIFADGSTYQIGERVSQNELKSNLTIAAGDGL